MSNTETFTMMRTMKFASYRRSFPILAILSIMMLAASSLSAQNFMFGPRVGFGFNTQAFEGQSWEFTSPSDLNDLRLSLQDASPETQLGMYGRIGFGGMYLQPEILLTTQSVKYLLEDINGDGEEVLDERNYHLAVPIMAGVKLGPFRAQAGPVYRARLASLSDLTDIEGMDRRYATSTLGVQAGLGLDLGRKVALDVRYETGLLQGRDEVTFLGQTHDLSQQTGQLVTSIGISF